MTCTFVFMPMTSSLSPTFHLSDSMGCAVKSCVHSEFSLHGDRWCYRGMSLKQFICITSGRIISVLHFQIALLTIDSVCRRVNQHELTMTCYRGSPRSLCCMSLVVRFFSPQNIPWHFIFDCPEHRKPPYESHHHSTLVSIFALVLQSFIRLLPSRHFLPFY